MNIAPYTRRQLWYLRRGTIITLHDKQEVESLRQAWLNSASPRLQAQKACCVLPLARKTWMVAVTPINQPLDAAQVQQTQACLAQAYERMADLLA